MSRGVKESLKKYATYALVILGGIGLFTGGLLGVLAAVEIAGILGYGLLFGTKFLKFERVPDNTKRIYIDAFGKKSVKESGYRLTRGWSKQVQDITTKIDTYDVPKVTAQTKNINEVKFNFSVSYYIVDALKYDTSAANARDVIYQLVGPAIKQISQGYNFEDLKNDRNKVSTEMEELLRNELKSYGIGLSSVKLQDIDYPEELDKARQKKLVVEEEMNAKKAQTQQEMDILKQKIDSLKVLYPTLTEQQIAAIALAQDTKTADGSKSSISDILFLSLLNSGIINGNTQTNNIQPVTPIAESAIPVETVKAPIKVKIKRIK